MHDAVTSWVVRWVPPYAGDPIDVLDVGGRDVNGTCRSLFADNDRYTVLDLRPGENVDIVASAATWEPGRAYDVVLSTEVFEHTADWREIIATSFRALAPGGIFIATAAAPGRPAHSGIHGNELEPGEHYAGIGRVELAAALVAAGFVRFEVDEQLHPADVRCVAWREG